MLLLSAVLGAWPLADPQWLYKGAYLAVVVALMFAACVLSARDRWRLEKRHAHEYGSQLLGLRSRVWLLLKELMVFYKQHESDQDGDLSTEFFHHSASMLGLIGEVGQVTGVLMPEGLQKAIDGGIKRPRDILLLITGIDQIDKALGELYMKALSDE